MKKVMVFGTFNTIEDRHKKLIYAAAEHGDGVMAVLARDEGMKEVGDDLTENECDRFANVMAIDVVDDVILAHGNHIDIIRTHRPSIVLIGEYQKDLAEHLYAYNDDLQECDCVIVHA